MRFVDVSRIRSTFEEPVVASDGTRLSADIYRPAQPGAYPVLVTRTPYDNNRMGFIPHYPTEVPSPATTFKRLAAHGFIVVACDVRGRGDSDGAFVAFDHEAQDGAETVEWARTLPEGNGRVGVFGSGYAGFTALAAATATTVDAVAAWSPFGTEGTPFRGSALRLDWLLWMHLAAGRTPQSVELTRWKEVFSHRPIIAMHEALGRDDIPWTEWLDGTADLSALDLGEKVAALTAPTLLVSGWWDSALTTTARYGRAMSGDGHALVIGPWDTAAVREPRPNVGGVRWGPSAIVDPDQMLIDWFAAHLRQAGEPQRGTRVFVTGLNEWAELDSTDAEPTTLWLSSGGRANTRRGDGRLVVGGADGPPDRFTHDPDNPVPWQPEYGSFVRNEAAAFTLDSAFATSRDDVLVYDGEPVESAQPLCGVPVAKLWVEVDAADADWVVAIDDLFPGGGRSVHLAHGVVRLGETQGPTEVTIELTPVAHVLLPGHAIRLTVASSLWPLYAVNLGGLDYLHGTQPRLSTHGVMHDSQFPSRIEFANDVELKGTK